MPSRNIADWGAQSIRAAVFSPEFDDFRADELYLYAFGQQPTAYQSAPPNLPYTPSTASGFVNAGTSTLQKTAGRLDLIMGPTQNTAPFNANEILQINDLAGGMETIQRAAVAVCGKVKSVSRLAFLADFFKSTRTEEDAKSALKASIPFDLELTPFFDFSIQYAKKFELDSPPNIQANLVFRWAISQIQQFTIPAGSWSNVSTTLPIKTFYAAILNLDANTIPEITHIDASQADTIYRGLREKVDEARRGQT